MSFQYINLKVSVNAGIRNYINGNIDLSTIKIQLNARISRAYCKMTLLYIFSKTFSGSRNGFFVGVIIVMAPDKNSSVFNALSLPRRHSRLIDLIMYSFTNHWTTEDPLFSWPAHACFFEHAQNFNEAKLLSRCFFSAIVVLFAWFIIYLAL